MSVSLNDIGGSAPVNYGLGAVLIADNQIARQRETTLTEQTSDGLISDSYSGLGSGATASLDLNAELAHENVWASNITAADGTMKATQDTLSELTSIASTFYSNVGSLYSAANLNAGQVAGLASQARTALKQVASLLDTQNDGAYVFSGKDSANPPVPDPDDILNSGFYTQISAAVGQLSANGAAATAASTLAIASSNATGTSPFSAALSQSAATLAQQRTTVTVQDGQQIAIGVVASANATVASTGSSTTGSYTRDLMRALATIGSLTDSQASDPNFNSLIEDTYQSLGGVISTMSSEAGVLGNVQSSMDASTTIITDTQTTLKTQISAVQDVDLANTASLLTQAQTQLQASYQMISDAGKMSLVDYL